MPEKARLQPSTRACTGTILRSLAFVSELRMAGHPSLMTHAKVGLQHPASSRRNRRRMSTVARDESKRAKVDCQAVR
jgi:hypothetical protein